MLTFFFKVGVADTKKQQLSQICECSDILCWNTACQVPARENRAMPPSGSVTRPKEENL